MNARTHTFLARAALLALLPACDLGTVPGDEPGDIIDGGLRIDAPRQIPNDPIDPPPDYVRASLEPLYRITPQSEFGRFEIFGQRMAATDFTSGATRISVEQKLAEIGAQIGAERGSGPLSLFENVESRVRAQEIPFRGNPTDVKIVHVDGVTKAYVPLGGGISDPGNEVAAVDLADDSVTRVTVGIHPQRLAVHEPSGLVFVCNQYSSYISIIDARRDQRLTRGGEAVEIPTELYCTDLLLVERDPTFGETEELFLYVANEYRASVLKYSIDIELDGNDRPSDVVVNPPAGQDPHIPIAEITGVGKNPYRLHLDQRQERIYVANNRGGELALLDIRDDTVLSYRRLDAPTMDVVHIDDMVYVPTTTPFRGLLSRNANTPRDADGDPVVVIGLDGQQHEAHPGALFDDTLSYNFEDLRNGIFQIDANLAGQADYLTDDNEADARFRAPQKVLAGAIPWDIERNRAGDRVFVALLGSDIVQELVVGTGAFRLQPQGGLGFETSELPAAIALDEDGGRLLVATMGGDFLEVFDLNDGERLAEIDLGYAQPRYPATTIEAGEYFYATAKWANDGRKACTSCHVDRFLTDGVGYSNGATAPTAYHQVKPNYNLLTTDSYFWNGSFVNNSYASLAFAAQSRTNCELILFGLIEGPDSDPAARVGDPGNFTSDGNDGICRPDSGNARNGLPAPLAQGDVNEDVNGDGQLDFADIQAVIGAQKQTAFQQIGLAVQPQLERIGQFAADDAQANRDVVSRAMDFYGAAELRLPPNPLAQMRELGMLSPSTVDKIAKGESIFNGVAGCASCHDPSNSRQPFADGRDHGRGAGFIQDFLATYDQDSRLLAIPGLEDGIPEQMRQTAGTLFTTQEINVHHDRLDYFRPFCFDLELCLVFDNPLAVRGSPAEDERLLRLALINLADPDRGFIPGQVVGQARVNTPSLRGVWLQHNLLRHGLAFTIREAILPPGHAALRPGERGWAVDRNGFTNVHGNTEDLSEAEVEALELYVQSIE